MRRAALVALLAGLALAPVARADGDPASDYLLTQPVFLPPDVVMQKSDSNRLVGEVAAAKARGFEIRVALIGTRYDMGSVGALYRRPQQYALFLGQELRFVYKGRLLVVMPNGYGVSRGGKAWPAGQAVVARLRPGGGAGPALAAAGSSAVRALAAASGVHVSASTSGGAASKGIAFAAIAAVVVVLLAGGIGAFVVRNRAKAA